MNWLDGVSAIIIAGYLGAVAIKGKAPTLLSYLKGELGYVEFMIAGAVLYQVTKLPEGGSIAKAFIGIAIVAGILKVISSISPQTFQSFASGQTDLITFITTIAQQVGQTLPQSGVQ